LKTLTIIFNHNTMEEEERPRKLQKTEHEEITELDSNENGEPMMSGALKTGDESVIAEQQTPNETIKSAPTAENTEEQTNENEQECTTEENGTAQAVPLSKRQQKRMLRQARWDAKREEQTAQDTQKGGMATNYRREWRQYPSEKTISSCPRDTGD
jgi:tRNA (guanine9-N1)-methyltransferase